MAKSSPFGPWHYRGYDIERCLDEVGPVEFVVTKDGGDVITCESSLEDAQGCIDDMIADAAEYYSSNVETIGDRR